MKSLIVRCPGRVAGQGSKNVGRGGVRYEASKYLKPWRNAVKGRVKTALSYNPDWQHDYPAVRVEVTFAHERPQHHYRTGRFSQVLREDAPLYYPQTPDIDKACRAILDALTQAGAIADDRRVVQLYATQVYADARTSPEPGAVVIVSEVPLTGEWSA